MSILEKRSATRVKALRNLVDKGEYPVEYALIKLDELNEKGLLTAKDYEEIFDYFDELLNKPEEIITESAEDNAENEQNNTEVDKKDTEQDTEKDMEQEESEAE